jgi:signal transduction histidine kinase/ActR/RegA family two-component response regulator
MEATRRTDRATENAAIGLWELDLSTNVARWNGQMFQKFGFDAAHGQPGTDAVWETLHEEGRASWKADFLRHAADPLAARWRGEFRAFNLEGKWRWLRSECAFERTEDGKGLRALGTTVDVTAEHEAADERAARTEADARNLAKTAFLSRMSHELRTPLNAVIGYAQLLGGGAMALPEAALERLKRIERSGWHLLALIDDVLDLSRIESHAMSVIPVSLSLADVAREAVVLVEPHMLKTGLTLNLDLPPLWVRADATRVQQILSNLLSNAVKYNRPGGTVSVRLHRQESSACIDVADTGLGLTAEQQAMLFEPFNRLGREFSGIEGTGIGLSIARALAKLMGGDITASSVAGHGSVFTLCLPLAEPGAQDVEPDQPAGAPLPDCTLDVLCVEDNEVNAMVLEESIRRLWPSWTVRQAATAAAALEALRSAPCDLMLLDLNLPDQTGLQMLAQARLENLVAASHVVVLSADVMPETRRDARDAGVTQFLDKPFRLTDLKRILEQAALVSGPGH